MNRDGAWRGSSMRMVFVTAIAIHASACTEVAFDETAEEVDSTAEAVRGPDGPSGTEVDGKAGVISLGWNVGGTYYHSCTGSMVGPTLIVTAAHCFDANTTSLPSAMEIRYFEPGLPASSPRVLWSGAGRVIQHPSWDGEWSNKYDADHDIAVVEIQGRTRWPGTTYRDYLRIYQDYGSRLPSSLDLYGAGFATLSGNGIGTLRMVSFGLKNIHDWRIQLDETQTKGSCKGDSGGPYIVRGHDLLACVVSGGWHDGDYCGQDDSFLDPAKAWCARSVWGNIGETIVDNTTVECTSLNDGTYDYTRCFKLPFVEDVEGEGLDQGLASAIVAVTVL